MHLISALHSEFGGDLIFPNNSNQIKFDLQSNKIGCSSLTCLPLASNASDQ